jgi:hypothetical protein
MPPTTAQTPDEYIAYADARGSSRKTRRGVAG